jgi:tripartite-type tricarboxylate transporter receptor subunit TctC
MSAKVLVLLAAMYPALACSQAYPTKPITLFLPFVAGGNTDTEARLYGQKLAEGLNGTVLIDYKPGAGTTVAQAYVAKAPPDGYTLLTTSAALTTAPAFYKNLSYDPVKDLAHITLISRRTTIFLSSPAFGPRNVPEFIAYAKANPGVVNFGTTGAGGAAHLAAAEFAMATGIKLTFIHYKGAAQQAQDLITNRVNVTFNALSSSLPAVRSGQLRALAISSIEPSPLLPNIKTISEQALPGYDYASWMGIAAPGRTPAAIISRLNTEFVKIARSPDVARQVAKDGTILVGNSPEQIRGYVISEISKMRKLVQETGIELEE